MRYTSVSMISLTPELDGVYISSTFSKPRLSICPTFMISMIMMVGRMDGIVTYQICCSRDAPSISAASNRSGLMEVMAAR